MTSEVGANKRRTRTRWYKPRHFFLSLEDKIFRLFGADKVKGLLDFLRVPEDQPLESERVSKVVKDTQTKVEAYYYELRKGVFDFDEVGSSREGSET